MMSSSFPTNNPYIKTAMQVSDFTGQIFPHSEHRKEGGLTPCVSSKTPSFVLAFFSTDGQYCLVIWVVKRLQGSFEWSLRRCHFPMPSIQFRRCFPHLEVCQEFQRLFRSLGRTDDEDSSTARCGEYAVFEAMNQPIEHLLQSTIVLKSKHQPDQIRQGLHRESSPTHFGEE